MNTTTTHVVEGIDLPTYESGLTDQGYLHLGGGVKIAVPDRHVEWLRQLVVAAEGAVQRIEGRTPKFDVASCDCQTDAPGPELQHPGTWLPGDQVQGRFLWSRGSHVWFDRDHTDSASDAVIDKWLGLHTNIVHLVPREGGAS